MFGELNIVEGLFFPFIPNRLNKSTDSHAHYLKCALVLNK